MSCCSWFEVNPMVQSEFILVPGGIIHHGIQDMLIPLEECVSEAMVEGLCRLLSLGQHIVVQKYGNAVASLQLTHTHK